MNTDHIRKESIIAVQRMRTLIPALGYVVTSDDAVKMAEIIDEEYNKKLKIAKDALGYYNNNDILTFEQQSIAENALKKINE